MSSSGSAAEEATVIVGTTADGASARAEATVQAAMPELQLGRYLVIEELGRGAMGVVLRAYDPKLQREVALKRVRVGKLERSAQARLVREARAMARLSHPSVVAVYDVETEPDASISDVLVVMEYVRGTTMSQWLRREKPGWKEIVAAFVSAGRGLAAAHAEGLLHRDFKPDNVLVGADGRVRVTDFGLARATGTRGSEGMATSGEFDRDDDTNVELTEAGTVMGTPGYMAPEQSIGAELDARADQYAFCVSLWRALTRAWPFEGGGHTALMQAKLRGPPVWPTEIAVPRHIVAAIRRGLSPVAEQRWPSLAELLAELGRDPGRRRQRLLGAGVLVVAGLAVWGTQRVQRARALSRCADEGERIAEVWHEPRARSIESAFEATQISYARDTWNRARPRLDAFASAWQSARGEVCERADLDRDLPQDLAMSARACLDEQRDVLEALLVQLAEPNAAVIQKSASASASLPTVSLCTDENYLRGRVESPDAAVRERVAELRTRLATAVAARETGHLDDAMREATAVADAATELGWAPLVAEAKIDLGDTYDDLGRYEDARVVLEDAYFGASAASRDDLALRAASLLVHVFGELARWDDGAHWGRLGSTIVARGRSDELTAASLRANLASLDFRRGEFAPAIEQYDEALAVRERVLGTEHPGVASTLNNLGLAYYGRGEVGVAIDHHERALAIWEHTLGENNPEVAVALHNLSAAYLLRNELDKGLAMSRRALAIWQATLGPEHPNVSAALQGLGNVYYDRGEYETALDYYVRAHAILERILTPEHLDLARTLFCIGSVHFVRDRFDDAFAAHERALELRRKHLGEEHRDVAQSIEILADIRHRQGRYAEALELAERAHGIRERTASSPSELAGAQFVLAKALWDGQGDRARALELATTAAASFRTLETRPEVRAELDAWLAAHDRN